MSGQSSRPSAQERVAQQARGGGDTAVDTPPKQKTLLEWLRDENQQAELATALSDKIDKQRFIRNIVTLCKSSPAIMECTKDSVLGAILRAGQLQLEPGPLGLSYLIPYNDRDRHVKELTLQIGYRGMIDLARRSGELASIEAHTVYEGDDFDYAYGTNKHLTHVPCPPSRRIKEAGKDIVFCYYGIAEYTNGGSNFEVVWPEVIEEHRQMSKMPNSPAWRDNFEAMAWKTCIRIMSRWLPMTMDFRDALAAEDQGVQSYKRITDPDIINATATEGEPDAPPPPPADGKCPECGAAPEDAHEQGCSKG